MAEAFKMNPQAALAELRGADEAATTELGWTLPYQPPPSAYTAPGLGTIDAALAAAQAHIDARVVRDTANLETTGAAVEDTETTSAGELST
jgi:hypothetical protein